MAKTEQWSVEDYRKHFGIKSPEGPLPIEEPAKKKKDPGPKPDGIQKANGQTTKYGNTKERIDGILFDSLKEADYYRMLKFRKERGTIQDFTVHKKYVFDYNGIRICSLTVDFNVFHLDGKEEVIDVKSFATRTKKDYLIRKKMLKAWYNIELVEK